jgi:hypothetical protein
MDRCGIVQVMYADVASVGSETPAHVPVAHMQRRLDRLKVTIFQQHGQKGRTTRVERQYGGCIGALAASR